MPNSDLPLVTILITAFGRPDELRQTLRLLRQQTYRPLEIVVVDDASPDPLRDVVNEEWPSAHYWRNERNLGLVASRSAAMQRVGGQLIFFSDDDSAPSDGDAIALAVQRFLAEPELGILNFPRYDGSGQPPAPRASIAERYLHTFAGGANMMRRSIPEAIGGFRDFFHYYGEEGEYSLRVISRGWRILLFPGVLIHHRVSPKGRSSGKIAAFSFRNSLWTVLLHMPFPRVLPEFAWKFTVGLMTLVKMLEIRCAAWAMYSFARGLPQVIRLRRPIDRRTLRLYDALRFGKLHVTNGAEIPRVRLREAVHWLREVWWQRRTPGWFWKRHRAPTGRSEWVTYE